MAKGYYLVVGDKTTCGGKIIEGDTSHTLLGLAVAREQDRVICGQHPGMYVIVGHIPGDLIHGRYFAGTLNSKSSCPCQARFIPSRTTDTYEFGVKSVIGTDGEKGLFIQSSVISDILQPFAESPYKGQTCNIEDTPLYNGVFLWTETQGAGHAFVSVHVKGEIYLFTYGRYDQAGFSPVGEGVLIKYQAEKAKSFYESELYRMSANVFQITDVTEDNVLKIFNLLWKSSERKPQGSKTSEEIKENGRIIDKYDLTGNNCTTNSISGLKSAGTTIFNSTIFGKVKYSEDFVIPSSLNEHLIKLSQSTDMRVINVTSTFKDNIINSSAHSKLEGAGWGNEVAGSLGKSSGVAGAESSGISAGTVGGVLGSVND